MLARASLGLLLFALGCETSAPAPAQGTSNPPGTAQRAAAGTGKYGAPLTGARKEPLASVLGEPSRFAGQPVTVEGHVRRACSKMGCWMELSTSADPNAQACRVIMKGHSFFVPKDSAGASARVEGVLEARRIEPDQVAHMEQEGGQFPKKAADGSAEELRFVATGVELWRG